MSNRYASFECASAIALIRIRIFNDLGATSAVLGMERLASRHSQKLAAYNMRNLVKNGWDDAGFLSINVPYSQVGIEMEKRSWDLAREQELSQRSEQVAEHWDEETWSFLNPPEYGYATYPPHIMAYVVPTVRGGWEWPFGSHDSTAAYREACRELEDDLPF